MRWGAGGRGRPGRRRRGGCGHTSNTIIALGATASQTPLPLIAINPSPPHLGRTLSRSELQARLETEVQKMVSPFQTLGNGGFLRPAYISDGGGVSNRNYMPEPNTYFRTPADTLHSLSAAYPHLSEGAKTNLRSYLAAFWQRFFVASQVRSIGWSSGLAREAMVVPPEVEATMATLGDVTTGPMPQRVFYAAWKYAQLVPAQAASIYSTVRPLLIHPPPTTLDVVTGPAVYNDYIAGYEGFLRLYDLAGTNPEPSLRASVANELTALLGTRIGNFEKDHPWLGSVDSPGGITANNYVRRFNCTRNFLYLTPELGGAMRSSARPSIRAERRESRGCSGGSTPGESRPSGRRPDPRFPARGGSSPMRWRRCPPAGSTACAR
jgi:hypothetical protein